MASYTNLSRMYLNSLFYLSEFSALRLGGFRSLLGIGTSNSTSLHYFNFFHLSQGLLSYVEGLWQTQFQMRLTRESILVFYWVIQIHLQFKVYMLRIFVAAFSYQLQVNGSGHISSISYSLPLLYKLWSKLRSKQFLIGCWDSDIKLMLLLNN